MKSNIGKRLAHGAIAAGVLATAAPANLWAQVVEIDEIIVTARKREEPLQTVPIAVTAFDAEALERSTIQSLSDVAMLTPGLVFEDLNAQLSVPIIRGVAPLNTVTDNAVGTYFNGVYLSNRRVLDVGMVDLERIEVIKGPQSALYGQDSFSGAINYVSRAPAEEFAAEIGGSAGSDEYYDGGLSLTGPLSERVQARAGVKYRTYDGSFENQADPDDNLQGYESTSASAALGWQVTDAFDVGLWGYYLESTGDNPAQYLVANNCGRTAAGAPTAFCGEVPADRPFDISPELVYGRDSESRIVALDLGYRFNDRWSVSSQTALVDTQSENYLDLDYTSGGVPFLVRNTTTGATRTVLTNTYLGQAGSDFSDRSEELKLSFAGERLNWDLGVYLYDSERRNSTQAAVDANPLASGEQFVSFLGVLFGTRTPGVPIPSNRSVDEVETRAVFTQLEFRATDRLRLTGELRYTEEEKSIRRILQFRSPVTTNANLSETFDYVAPRLTADLRWTDSVLLYATWAIGNRPGGFNASATLPAELAFDPEKIDSYEVGVKSEWLERRVLANVAAYYLDWSDVQVAARSSDPANISNVTLNTGNAIVNGLEAETRFRVTDSLQLGVNYAYTNPRYKQGSFDRSLLGACGVGGLLCAVPGDVGGRQLARTVNHQYSAFVDFEDELANGWSWYAHADVARLGNQYLDALNVTEIGAHTVVNARLGLAGERWDLALWGKNLGDEEYITGITNQPKFHTGNVVETTFGDRRRYGLTLTWRFAP